ncbi:MarR family winged helix-turn-helix transcriptional regulator [Ensifer sp. LCM 4579]|uniref:MarR family winged helix-turn-helix transcriptional regulator n=1 Tax=Ensifer sp. LCM 4579 TaxID=1848292 RepID=UPI0008D9767D|nr:MarR family transcriptional regulator [Ensifer sp. LCM 4579]OHV77946.1 hypothetical protein LCM4579_06230 [Ensifer sp. LCM 4579]
MERSSKAMQVDQVWRQLSARTIFLHQAIADHLGLNITDHKCLDLLLQNGPMTAGELAQASGLTTGAITGVVDRLEKKGYVRRVADDTDRRKRVIVIQHDRLSEIEKIFNYMSERTNTLVGGYTQDQLQTIHDFLERTTGLVDEFILHLNERRRS